MRELKIADVTSILIKTKIENYKKHAGILAKTFPAPSDPCLTDLDRILTEGQDPGAQQYLVLGTVPIKGKNWGFGCPCIFCTRYRAHQEKNVFR